MGRQQLTFGMVKPHAYAHRNEIERIIESSGLEILITQNYVFDESSIHEQYSEPCHKAYFPEVGNAMMEGPVHMMLICGEDAIKKLLDITGPSDPGKKDAMSGKRIRDIYALDRKIRSAFHRSDSEYSARREIDMHFGIANLAPEHQRILNSYAPWLRSI